MTATHSRPVPFEGSDKQRRANIATHQWVLGLDGEIRCIKCDHKPWHVGADYPCGTKVPREEFHPMGMWTEVERW